MKKQKAWSPELELGLEREAREGHGTLRSARLAAAAGPARAASCGRFDAVTLLLAGFFTATTRASCPADPSPAPLNAPETIMAKHLASINQAALGKRRCL